MNFNHTKQLIILINDVLILINYENFIHSMIKPQKFQIFQFLISLLISKIF